MLNDQILSTLAYYDVLDFPLTAAEISRYLVQSSKNDIPTFLRMSECLDELVRDGMVGEREGFYFIQDREYLVPMRKRREQHAQTLWRKMHRVAWAMRFVPFIKVVFVSGSLSINNTDELSDLDIIVVARHGRIWLTRLLTLALLSVMGVRRTHRDRIAPDKVCPNHFITDQSLSIPFHSLYTAQLYANVIPVVANDLGMVESFKKANSWVSEFVAGEWVTDMSRLVPSGFARFTGRLFELMLFGPIGNLFERAARSLQLYFIKRHADAPNPGSHVEFTDLQLAFHPKSSESRILARYSSLLGTIDKGIK